MRGNCLRAAPLEPCKLLPHPRALRVVAAFRGCQVVSDRLVETAACGGRIVQTGNQRIEIDVLSRPNALRVQ